MATPKRQNTWHYKNSALLNKVFFNHPLHPLRPAPSSGRILRGGNTFEGFPYGVKQTPGKESALQVSDRNKKRDQTFPSHRVASKVRRAINHFVPARF